MLLMTCMYYAYVSTDCFLVNNIGISYDHPEYYADIEDEKVTEVI